MNESNKENGKENTELISKFKNNLQITLNRNVYEVKAHESILSNPIYGTARENPTRGKNALQADIVIKNSSKNLVLVVVELKTGESFTTHDVMIYSRKAQIHKIVYPWLRYGLVWFSNKPINRRFFKYNEFMDFAGGISQMEVDKMEGKWRVLIDIISKQLEVAMIMQKLFLGEDKNDTPTFFSSEIRFWFGPF
ncbi:MAG: hypothetical protein ACP5TX_06060 [Thermoplasmata archaeon]